MIPDTFKTLIERLKEKTAKKEAVWYITSRDSEFKLDLSKGAITVDNWMDNNDGNEYVDCIILNENGDTIDRIFFSTEDSINFNYLMELYVIVKRAYYKIDETIKSILDELDSDKIIGLGEK